MATLVAENKPYHFRTTGTGPPFTMTDQKVEVKKEPKEEDDDNSASSPSSSTTATPDTNSAKSTPKKSSKKKDEEIKVSIDYCQILFYLQEVQIAT